MKRAAKARDRHGAPSAANLQERRGLLYYCQRNRNDMNTIALSCCFPSGVHSEAR